MTSSTWLPNRSMQALFEQEITVLLNLKTLNSRSLRYTVPSQV